MTSFIGLDCVGNMDAALPGPFVRISHNPGQVNQNLRKA